MSISHPITILDALNRNLDHVIDLTIYGRAALAVGFPDSPPAWHATMDVDAILPLQHLSVIEADLGFWQALDRVNQDLEPEGLYFTHLFEDSQVILRPNWLEKRIEISRLDWPNLALFRPATIDLVLSKMMRVDPEDRSDILFLMKQEDMNIGEFKNALAEANIPDIPEIRSAFEINKPWIFEQELIDES